MISILTPAFNESTNLEALYERLASAMTGLGLDWEWVIVDDHSRDDTFGVIQRLASRDARIAELEAELAALKGKPDALPSGH